MQSTAPLPRNYASTHLPAAHPGSCFDLSDLIAYAALNPVDHFDLDAEECPSTTPRSEDDETDGDLPLELNISSHTSAAMSSGTSPLTLMSSRTPSPPRSRVEQDILIARVIRKLECYKLSLNPESEMADEVEMRISRSGMVGTRPAAVTETGCMLWTKVWGSAEAVKNARARRGRRIIRTEVVAGESSLPV